MAQASGSRSCLGPAAAPAARAHVGALIAAAVSVLIATACGTPAAALPPHGTIIRVTMSEYRFVLSGPVPRGRVVFQVHNAGHTGHDLSFVELPPGFPPLPTHPYKPGHVATALSTIAVLPTLGPGRDGTFAVDLAPGRYGMICFAKDADGVQHTFKGMNVEFLVS